MQNNKKIILLLLGVMTIGAILLLVLIPKKQTKVEKQMDEEPLKTEEKIDIIDMNSKIRPYAVVVNNTPVAVKVQEGLHAAYAIYEFPTEGNTSRLMAVYKTDKDVTVGTIRSVRHNFIDYAHENGAIMVGFGWSPYAKDEV